MLGVPLGFVWNLLYLGSSIVLYVLESWFLDVVVFSPLWFYSESIYTCAWNPVLPCPAYRITMCFQCRPPGSKVYVDCPACYGLINVCVQRLIELIPYRTFELYHDTSPTWLLRTLSILTISLHLGPFTPTSQYLPRHPSHLAQEIFWWMCPRPEGTYVAPPNEISKPVVVRRTSILSHSLAYNIKGKNIKKRELRIGMEGLNPGERYVKSIP